MSKGKYIIESVDGDGEWYEKGRSTSERAACRRADAITKNVADTYGQRLRHTGTGRRVGDSRVLCPDGTVLEGIDLVAGAN